MKVTRSKTKFFSLFISLPLNLKHLKSRKTLTFQMNLEMLSVMVQMDSNFTLNQIVGAGEEYDGIIKDIPLQKKMMRSSKTPHCVLSTKIRRTRYIFKVLILFIPLASTLYNIISIVYNIKLTILL